METPVVPFAPTAAVRQALERRHRRSYAKAKHDILSHPHRRQAAAAAVAAATVAAAAASNSFSAAGAGAR